MLYDTLLGMKKSTKGEEFINCSKSMACLFVFSDL